MSQDSFSLSHAMPRIGGVLLAGGRGRRFDPQGQRHKLLARLPSGQSLIRVAATQLLPWVDTLTVVVGVHNVGLMRELADLPLQVVVCCGADAGPGATLRQGFAASLNLNQQARVDGLLISLADMPFIAESTYAQLSDQLRAHLRHQPLVTEKQAWRALYGEAPGHPVALTRALAQHYLSMPVDQQVVGKGLAVLWRENPAWLIKVRVDDPGCVHDIDVPEDLT